MRIYRWIFLKYSCYVLLGMLLFHLQSAPYFLNIAGIRPMPVIALAFAVALEERELAGGLFAIFCGYLCDLFSYTSMGYYMMMLFALCVAAGLIVHNYLRSSWPISFLVTLLGMLLCRFVLLFFRYLLPGVPCSWYEFISRDLPMSLYTAVLAIPLYFLVRYLHNSAIHRTETRF